MTSNYETLNNYLPPDFVACGLLFYQGGGGIGKASTNTFAGNEKDVCTAGNGPQN